jgi:hypothetical protein
MVRALDTQMQQSNANSVINRNKLHRKGVDQMSAAPKLPKSNARLARLRVKGEVKSRAHAACDCELSALAAELWPKVGDGVNR